MGGLSFASSLFGSMGSRREAKRRNKARKQNWEHQLRVRKQGWYQNLSIWGAQRNKYFIDINENDLAAQRGYAQAQVQINNEFAKAAQANEGALIKYLQGSGKLAAAGRTGRSIQRLATLDLGAMERQAGRRYYQLTKSRESFKEITENIRRQQMSQRNQLHANVAFAPVPDLPPPAPKLEAESMGIGDYLKAGFSGITSYAGAGGKMPKGLTKLLGGKDAAWGGENSFWATGEKGSDILGGIGGIFNSGGSSSQESFIDKTNEQTQSWYKDYLEQSRRWKPMGYYGVDYNPSINPYA